MLGEISRDELALDWNGGQFAVVFGALGFEEFKRDLNIYPREAVQRLVDNGKPVRYCRIENYQATQADIQRRYKFFVFDNQYDVRWWHARKEPAVGNVQYMFKLSQHRCARDAWRKLVQQDPRFLGAFYRATKNFNFASTINMQLIWSSSDRSTRSWIDAGLPTFMDGAAQPAAGQPAAGQPGGEEAAPADNQGNVQPRRGQVQPNPALRGRDYVVDIVRQRLEIDMVGKTIGYPIVKRSDHNHILVPGGVRHNNRWSRYHRITREDALAWAQSYDDQEWLNHSANEKSREMRSLMDRLLDVNGIEAPPEEQPEPELTPEEQEKLDRTLDAVNSRLDGTGISVQITEPGHRPRYIWHQKHAQQQAQGWPNDDRRFFAVMFSGIDPEKMFDQQAEQFLRQMNLWRFVEPAYAAAREEYEDIHLAVALDNGI